MALLSCILKNELTLKHCAKSVCHCFADCSESECSYCKIHTCIHVYTYVNYIENNEIIKAFFVKGIYYYRLRLSSETSGWGAVSEVVPFEVPLFEGAKVRWGLPKEPQPFSSPLLPENNWFFCFIISQMWWTIRSIATATSNQDLWLFF